MGANGVWMEVEKMVYARLLPPTITTRTFTTDLRGSASSSIEASDIIENIAHHRVAPLLPA